jgi:hypothetical protein
MATALEVMESKNKFSTLGVEMSDKQFQTLLGDLAKVSTTTPNCNVAPVTNASDARLTTFRLADARGRSCIMTTARLSQTAVLRS